MNPIIWLILHWRRQGAKHSDIPWPSMRAAYDYAEQQVEVTTARIDQIVKIIEAHPAKVRA